MKFFSFAVLILLVVVVLLMLMFYFFLILLMIWMWDEFVEGFWWGLSWFMGLQGWHLGAYVYWKSTKNVILSLAEFLLSSNICWLFMDTIQAQNLRKSKNLWIFHHNCNIGTIDLARVLVTWVWIKNLHPRWWNWLFWKEIKRMKIKIFWLLTTE